MWHSNTRRPRRAPPPRHKTQTTPRQQPNSHITLKRQAKAPIRLRACAGLSKALLVAHTPSSEIPCTGSDNIYCKKQKANNSKANQSKANLKQKVENKTRHNTEGIHIQDHPISRAALGTAGMTLPPASCLEDCSRSGEPRT